MGLWRTLSTGGSFGKLIAPSFAIGPTSHRVLPGPRTRDFHREYGVRIRLTIMAYEPRLGCHHEPFVLGVGVVFNGLFASPHCIPMVVSNSDGSIWRQMVARKCATKVGQWGDMNGTGETSSRARKPWSANCELKQLECLGGGKCPIHGLHFTV